jgi:DNA-binding beta-propeller fold protein YncE
MRGNGDGAFNKPATDFNGDGNPDLVVTNTYSNNVTVLTNVTRLWFRAPVGQGHAMRCGGVCPA